MVNQDNLEIYASEAKGIANLNNSQARPMLMRWRQQCSGAMLVKVSECVRVMMCT